MLYTAATWILSILYILSILFMILGNIIRFKYWISCHIEEPTCGNRKCPNKYFCEKYRELCTQEDLIALAGIIEFYKQKKKS